MARERDEIAFLSSVIAQLTGRRIPGNRSVTGYMGVLMTANPYREAAAPATDAARFSVRSSDWRSSSRASFLRPAFEENLALKLVRRLYDVGWSGGGAEGLFELD